MRLFDWVFLFAALAFCIGLTIVTKVIERKIGGRKAHGIFAFILIVWFAVSAYLAYFMRTPDIPRAVFWIPFEGYTLGSWLDSGGFVVNILVFYPLGLLLKRLGMRTSRAAACVLLCTFAIEVSQYLSCRGYCEVNDIIANTIGGAAGIMIGKKY